MRRENPILWLLSLVVFTIVSSWVGALWHRRNQRKADELADRLGRD